MSAIMPTYGRLPVTFASGAGAYLTDQKGRQYLDALSGIAVTNLGHSHPCVTRLTETKVCYTSIFTVLHSRATGCELTNSPAWNASSFATRGQRQTRRRSRWQAPRHNKGIANPQIVVLEGAFHGANHEYTISDGRCYGQTAFKPLLPGFIRIARNDTEALEAIKTRDDIVAIH